MIKKPVEIIGDGTLGEVVIEATGKEVVKFQANMGRIANLTLRHAGGRAFRYGSAFGYSCIQIAQGRLVLEGCDVTTTQSACVIIYGGGDPRLLRNRIHGAKIGVLVDTNGLGTLEENEIFANANAGVAIATGGNPTLRRNRVSKNHTAICVFNGGQGVIEDNDLRENATGAWNIAPDCEENVKRARNKE